MLLDKGIPSVRFGRNASHQQRARRGDCALMMDEHTCLVSMGCATTGRQFKSSLCINCTTYALCGLFAGTGGQQTFGPDCARTVHESNVLTTLGLALSEKQIPRFVRNVSS